MNSYSIYIKKTYHRILRGKIMCEYLLFLSPIIGGHLIWWWQSLEWCGMQKCTLQESIENIVLWIRYLQGVLKKWKLLLVIVAVTSSFFGTPCTNWSAKVFVIMKNQIYTTIVKYHILNIYEISNIFLNLSILMHFYKDDMVIIIWRCVFQKKT